MMMAETRIGTGPRAPWATGPGSAYATGRIRVRVSAWVIELTGCSGFDKMFTGRFKFHRFGSLKPASLGLHKICIKFTKFGSGSCLDILKFTQSSVIELARRRHLDETGLHRVCTGFDQTWSGLVGSYHSNRPVSVCTKFLQSSCNVRMVCALFTWIPGFFLGKSPGIQTYKPNANIEQTC